MQSCIKIPESHVGQKLCVRKRVLAKRISLVCEAEKVASMLQLRVQDVENARPMGGLKTTGTQRNCLKVGLPESEACVLCCRHAVDLPESRACALCYRQHR